MVVEAAYGIGDWTATSKVSQFTEKLIETAHRYQHVIARSRPKFINRGDMEVFDPRVVCLAVEGFSEGGGPKYDNIRLARRILESIYENRDRIISEGGYGNPYSAGLIPIESVFSFLDPEQLRRSKLSLADNIEAFQEMVSLYQRGEPAPLHRIDDREEAIAHKLRIALSLDKRVFLVLDHHHFLSLNRHAMDENRRERDRYLLYDFMDREGIPYVVVVPALPKFYPGEDIEQLKFDWEMAITGVQEGCYSYEPLLAEVERSSHYLDELIDGRPELKERLKMAREEGRQRKLEVASEGEDVRAESNKTQESYEAEFNIIKNDPEIRYKLEEFERKNKREQEERMRRIKKL
ncbi:MAG TPA: hypothetical protein VJB06_00440 [archaeon]|nr:hypothetical protein [archaeon]